METFTHKVHLEKCHPHGGIFLGLLTYCYNQLMRTILVGGVNGSLNPGDEGFDDYGKGKGYFVRKMIDDIRACDSTKVAIVTAAKENKHHFDELMADSGIDMDAATVLNTGDNPDWSDYEVIIMTGGSTQRLHDWLAETGFSLDKLDNCELLIGESAGAYVLGAKVIAEYTPDGKELVFIDGFNPKSRVLVAAHVNNPYYHRDGLTLRLEKYCTENDLKLVLLEENEVAEL